VLARRRAVHALRALDHVVHEPLDLDELLGRAEQEEGVEVAVSCERVGGERQLWCTRREE